MLQFAAFIAFPVVVILAAVSDLFTMTISNRFSLLLIVGFAIAALFVPGMDLQLAGMHLLAAGLTLAITFSLFAFGIIGGGDAKLAAAIALWLGWSHLLEFGIYTGLFGGVLSVAVLGFRAIMLPDFAIRQPWIARLHDQKGGVPYGIALAAAALFVYPKTIWIAFAG